MRILNAEWRDDRLVATHAVGIGGDATVRWYEFDVSGAAPALVQSGEIDPGPGVHTYFPSIAIDAEGDLGVTYMQSSDTEFVSMYVAGRLADDPPGTMRDGVLVKAGQTTYGGTRGGDYSGIAVDPVDNTFWAGNEVILANAFWSTWLAQFQVGSADDADWYQFDVRSGDVLNIATSTTAAGPGQFVNDLDVGIELVDPAGALIPHTNGPGDELFTHTATHGGSYRVRVFAQPGTQGEYLVTVSGATGGGPAPQVVATNPADGVTVPSLPTTVRIDFSQALLVSSVDAGDLIVAGLPALSVAAIDGDTFEFTIDPSIDRGVDAVYDMVLPVGSVLDLQRHGNLSFQGAFKVDQTAPRIVATSWNGAPQPAPAVFPEGPLVFTATFDEELKRLVSAAKGPKAPSPDDVVLVENVTGTVTNPTAVDFDTATNTFTARFDAPLAEGDYTLTLTSGDGAFEDLVGNDMDGEPIGPNPDGTPTGDGAPGGDYVVGFGVDRVRTPARGFEPIEPLQGLMFVSRANAGLMNFADDEDDFTFYLEKDQTVAAIATPDDPNVTLRLTVPGVGAPFVVSSAPGQPVVLPPQLIASNGVVAVRVASDGRTPFALDVYRNASLEFELGDSDDGRALTINASFIPLGSGRYGVVGRSDAQTLTLNALVFGAQPLTGQIVAMDPFTGIVATRFAAPDALAVGHTMIGLSGGQGTGSLLYINADLDPSALYRMDATSGAVRSIETTDSRSYDGLGFESGAGAPAVGQIYLNETGGPVRLQAGFSGAVSDHFTAASAGTAIGGDDAGRQFVHVPGMGIVEHDPFAPHTLLNTLPAPAADLVGMAFDGLNLYASTASGDLHVLDPDDGSVLSTISVPGGALFGLATIGQSVTPPPQGAVLFGSDRDGTLFSIDQSTGRGTSICALAEDSTEIEFDPASRRAVSQLPYGAFMSREFDINNGTPIGPPVPNGFAFNGMEWVGPDLYGTAISAPQQPSSLRRLDPFTGTSTLVGATGAGPIAGLAHDPATDTLFGIAGGPGPALLFVLDRTTGVAAPVGSTGIQAGSLEFGPDGVLYAGGTGPDSGDLYSIDTATGAGTLIGPTGFGPVTGLMLVTPPPNGGTTFTIPDIDVYALDMTGKAGQRISVVLSGADGADFADQLLELLDDAGNVLAIGVSDPTGVAAQSADLGIGISSCPPRRVRSSRSASARSRVANTPSP